MKLRILPLAVLVEAFADFEKALAALVVVDVLGNDGPRLPAAVLLALTLRQSKFLPHMITAHDRVVAGKAVHHKAIGRGAIELDCKRAILGAVSRPGHERLAAADVAAKDVRDLVDRKN
jgi:hypothetical protein